MVVHDLGRIRDQTSKILAVLDPTCKRLYDANTPSADQNRRIEDTDIHHIGALPFEMNKQMYDVHSCLITRFDGMTTGIGRFLIESVSRSGTQTWKIVCRA